MCGIAAIVRLDGTQVPEENPGDLTDLVAHRGPDSVVQGDSPSRWIVGCAVSS